ncbi:MAG TPA: hypothetical protein VJU79_04455, partial [Candidatus Dormibacteraeota bacterium]|nr:hypothetical protein [Candidatus Dormibacteraeota bacterium]
MAASGALRVHVVGRPRLAWAAAFAAVAVLVVVRNLVDLSGSPPGLYADEASIGYNAWAIANYGVDEHGARLPLYFQAFGEYKNPVYVYVLVPFLRFLTLTPTVERLPAVLFGLVSVLFLTMAAWRVTRSVPLTFLALLLVALTPWLTLESRVGFEVIAMVAALSVALWALAHRPPLRLRHWALAGVCFGIAVFAYSTGRLEVGLYTLAFLVIYGISHRWRGKWWITLAPIAAAYLVLGVWSLQHPGAITARFAALFIGADGAPIGTVITRFFSNYVQYFTPEFLFVHGDINLRHSTQSAGMLLWITAPLLIAGLIVCWQRRRETLPIFTVVCLVLGPVAGSLTENGGFPHALRSAGMLPFWMLLAFYGMGGIAQLLREVDVRAALAVAGLLVASLLLQGERYTQDLFTDYPVRAAGYFDAGEALAMPAAESVAQGSTVYLSSQLDVPYIAAFFALRPPPPSKTTADAEPGGLARLHMVVIDPQLIDAVAASGDVVVLVSNDRVPDGAVLVARPSQLV